MKIQKRIEDKLQQHLQPTYLAAYNESDRHHVPANSETHFRVIVVSSKFIGQNRIGRHRLVHDLLAEELRDGVHALSLKLWTPEEFKEQGHQEGAASPNCMGANKTE